MKEVAELLNGMLQGAVIRNYAVFGAVAQMRYTDSVVTVDVDILVDLPDMERLDPLRPIYEHCERLGLEAAGEAIRVGGWPVQFITVFSDLTREALENAEETDLDGALVRVISAEYLAVIALSVGRAKDHARVIALLEAEAVDRERLEALATRHGLTKQWEIFRRRFLDE